MTNKEKLAEMVARIQDSGVAERNLAEYVARLTDDELENLALEATRRLRSPHTINHYRATARRELKAVATEMIRRG